MRRLNKYDLELELRTVLFDGKGNRGIDKWQIELSFIDSLVDCETNNIESSMNYYPSTSQHGIDKCNSGDY